LTEILNHLIERFDFDDRRTVIAADPERAGIL
jgi:hypothetical protein